jgi:prophage maintenance system killer protein
LNLSICQPGFIVNPKAGLCAFNDGNKRTAVSATATFLQMNGIALEVDEDELVAFAVRVANEKVANQDIAKFLRGHACLDEVDLGRESD